MNLNTSQILEYLRNDPTRYIEHEMGRYRLKEADGTDVMFEEYGRQIPIEPVQAQIDDLIDSARLVRHGSRYVLAPSEY